MDDIAHEIWSAAQLMPGEGIEDGVDRIVKILDRHPENHEKTINPCPKTKTWKSDKYLAHVRAFPCAVCCNPETEAHHIRFSHICGTGQKSSDFWSLPLCVIHHREFHDMGINSFQKKYNIDIFQALFKVAIAWIETISG